MLYKATIGLEIHAELCTSQKLFCACPVSASAPANTACCPVCLGYPGAMPVLNREAVEKALLLGTALGCHIHRTSSFDRKNYFYPDNPTAYQITQYTHPICTGGQLVVETEDGTHSVLLERIHIEQDAAKLLHRPGETRIDYNRCGVPLLEIVTQPSMHTPQEAAAFLQALREILLYLKICDGKMQQGSLRCDANVSISASEHLGTVVELKNINSIRFLKKALQYEIERQQALAEQGIEILKETRRYNEKTETTEHMRRKESAVDYRYCPEPDLGVLQLTQTDIHLAACAVPRLPAQIRSYYRACGLSAIEAAELTRYPAVSAFAEAAIEAGAQAKLCCDFIRQSLFVRLGADEWDAVVLADPQDMVTLCHLTEQGLLSRKNAQRLASLLFAGEKDARRLAQTHGLLTIQDEETLQKAVQAVFREQPGLLASCRAGEKGARSRALGLALRATGQRGDPLRLRTWIDYYADKEE